MNQQPSTDSSPKSECCLLDSEDEVELKLPINLPVNLPSPLIQEGRQIHQAVSGPTTQRTPMAPEPTQL